MNDSGAFPAWLHGLAIVSLSLGLTCAVHRARRVAQAAEDVDHERGVARHRAVRERALACGYYAWGRASAKGRVPAEPSLPASVATGTSHCGAGCTLGDILAEWLAFVFPGVAVWFGWHSLFAEKMFAVWVLDFLLAFVLGIGFQYFTIKPMRHLSVGKAILAALKVDTASITAWQIGMFGMMALIQFGWFRGVHGALAPVDSPEFWFAMQLAMLAGFATSYPINWWLIRIGMKERM